jgi:hypothetical protein
MTLVPKKAFCAEGKWAKSRELLSDQHDHRLVDESSLGSSYWSYPSFSFA